MEFLHEGKIKLVPGYLYYNHFTYINQSQFSIKDEYPFESAFHVNPAMRDCKEIFPHKAFNHRVAKYTLHCLMKRSYC